MSDQAPAQPDDAQRQAMRAATKRIDRVNDWFHVGGAIPQQEYERLSAAGITHVVDLREDAEVDTDHARLEQLTIARLQVPVPNHGAPSLEQLVQIADWLEAADNETVVYVHCGGGFGRAATMAVGLLLLDEIPLDQAIALVRSVRPEIRINKSPLSWLRSVEAKLRLDRELRANSAARFGSPVKHDARR